MPRSYTRFYTPGSALGTRRRGRFLAILGGKIPPSRQKKKACANVRHYVQAPPQKYNTKKIGFSIVPKTRKGRETKSPEGDEVLGGKTKFCPARDVTGRIAMEIETRRTCLAREGLPVEKRARSPSHGLCFGSPWPSRDRSHDRTHPTGTRACENRVCRCASLHGVPPTKERLRFLPRGRESWSLDPSTHGSKTGSEL